MNENSDSELLVSFSSTDKMAKTLKVCAHSSKCVVEQSETKRGAECDGECEQSRGKG